jgi:hypothetical protein
MLARPCAAAAALVFGIFQKGALFGTFLPTDRYIEKCIICSGGKRKK